MLHDGCPRSQYAASTDFVNWENAFLNSNIAPLAQRKRDALPYEGDRLIVNTYP